MKKLCGSFIVLATLLMLAAPEEVSARRGRRGNCAPTCGAAVGWGGYGGLGYNYGGYVACGGNYGWGGCGNSCGVSACGYGG